MSKTKSCWIGKNLVNQKNSLFTKTTATVDMSTAMSEMKALLPCVSKILIPKFLACLIINKELAIG